VGLYRQKHKTLFEKQPKARKARGLAQVVEHLPSKLKALCSNPNMTKKKERERERCCYREKGL
jgi:hypothetical protein